jgi:L-2-hydroxyglutarate oxidase LhgO
MENYPFDVAVIGAGVVGLAIARHEALLGRKVVLVEKASNFGLEGSSRNSEVIHAGIYYPHGSLKHRLCIRGRKLLTEYIAKEAIPSSMVGKVIFCSNKDRLEDLAKIKALAEKNGVAIYHCSEKRLKRLSDFCKAQGGLWSPSTGIFDSNAFMVSLASDIENKNGTIALRTKVETIDPSSKEIKLSCDSAGGKFFISAPRVYNSAGLHALDVAQSNGLTSLEDAKNFYVKGHYYSLKQKVMSPHLLYPLPDRFGLGVHLTLDLAGGIKFGPDAYPIGEAFDYAMQVSDQEFFDQINENFPAVRPHHLLPAYSGVRPKIIKNGSVLRDFVIEKSETSKVVSLMAIDSPGLTCSLAIAEYAVNLMG